MSQEGERPAGQEKVGDYVSIFLRGKVWYANYQKDGEQHRESLKTSNKKEALSRARKKEIELQEGTW